MNAKVFLNRYQNKYEEIKRTRAQIVALWSTLQTVNNDGMPKADGVSDRVGNIASELADIESQYDWQIDELELIRNEIVNVIERVPDSFQGTVLIRRYIGLESWKDISTQMFISESYARGKLHDKAIGAVQKILDERDLER